MPETKDKPKNQEKKNEETPRLERRILTVEDMELRVTDDEQPKLTGYIAKFGKWSLDLGGFIEKIRSGAFDEALEKSDIRCLKNHDPNLLLGRSTSGTLRLKTNSVGLRFEDDVPDTNTGRDTVQEVRRKDITGCSFSFTTAEDDWKYFEDGRVERTIIKVGELFDVGPVTFPAYPDTTVAARSMDENRKTEDIKQLEEERKKQAGEKAENEERDQEVKDKELEEEKKKDEKNKRQQQLDTQRKYREAGCIIARCEPADV